MILTKMILKRLTITIVIITLTICSLYAQGLRKTNIQWKGKSIEVAEESIVIKVKKNISKSALTNKT